MAFFEGSAACPACGDLHWVRGLDAMAGKVGVPRDVLQQSRIDHYWRVREPRSATHATILTSETRSRAYRACLCGAKLAIVLDLEARPHGEVFTLALLGWRFLEIRRSDFAEQIDYAWDHIEGRFKSALAVEARLAALREQMTNKGNELRFPHDELARAAGPTRCEACGDVRERAHATHLWTGTGFFGPAVPEQQLFLGSRVAFDDAWLAKDIARPPFFRARHPVATDQLAILHRSRNWGCRCGAGRASFVTRFARLPGELELVDLSIRVAATRAQLDGIDFVYMPPEAEDCHLRASLFSELERIESMLF